MRYGEIPYEIRDPSRQKNYARKSAKNHEIWHTYQTRRNWNTKLEGRWKAHFNERWGVTLSSWSWLWKLQNMLRTERTPLSPIHRGKGIVHSEEDNAAAFADNLERQYKLMNQDDDNYEDSEAQVHMIERTRGNVQGLRYTSEGWEKRYTLRSRRKCHDMKISRIECWSSGRSFKHH